MAEAIQTAIAAALAPNGAIHTAILAEIQKAFEQGQPGDLAIVAGATSVVNTCAVPAVAEALKDKNSEISQLIKSEYDRRADESFPYRAKLRELSVAEWTAAWRDLVVDSDQVSWTMQAVEQNPVLANIMALSASHPTNVELQELKKATTARYAAKVSWKKLCLGIHGGSWDKLKNFLLEKADSPLENVKALARSLLVLINLIERRCTVVQSAKRNGPEKAAAQRTALMDTIYQTIKQYKRRTTKSSASSTLEHEVLLRDFAQDIILGEAAMAVWDPPKRFCDAPGPAGSQPTGGGAQPPAKVPRLSTPADGPAAAASPVAGTDPKGTTQKKQLVNTLLQELKVLVGKKTPPKKIQAWIDKQYQSDDHRNAMILVLRDHACRNCLMAGKGVIKHTLKQCREQKNPCFLPCTKCTAAGRTTNLFHWVAECPH